MNLIFWVLWVANLLLAIFLVLATDFRKEMNLTTGLNYLLLLLAFGAAIVSLVLYFSGKHRSYSLWLVSAPLLLLLGWWMVEKLLGKA